MRKYASFTRTFVDKLLQNIWVKKILALTTIPSTLRKAGSCCWESIPLLKKEAPTFDSNHICLIKKVPGMMLKLWSSWAINDNLYTFWIISARFIHIIGPLYHFRCRVRASLLLHTTPWEKAFEIIGNWWLHITDTWWRHIYFIRWTRKLWYKLVQFDQVLGG